jgi:hypothetical protein
LVGSKLWYRCDGFTIGGGARRRRRSYYLYPCLFAALERYKKGGGIKSLTYPIREVRIKNEITNELPIREKE